MGEFEDAEGGCSATQYQYLPERMQENATIQREELEVRRPRAEFREFGRGGKLSDRDTSQPDVSPLPATPR